MYRAEELPYSPRVWPIPKKGLRVTVLDSGAVVVSYELDTVCARRLDVFPPAERAVVERMLAGLRDEAIALERGCSRHTVSNLLRSAYRRVGVTSRAELAAYLSSPSGEGGAEGVG